jgi:subtilisin family serine protease
MKSLRTFLGLSSILLALGFFGLQMTHAIQESSINSIVGQSDFVPNEVLVKFKNGTSEYAIRQSIQAVSGSVISYRGESSSVGLWAEDKTRYASFVKRPNLFLLRVPSFLGTEQAIRNLVADINIEYAEKNHLYEVSLTPDDTYFSYQWGLNNTGQTSGTSDADIDAPEAWETYTGSSDICMAIIDTGIDYSHTDLQSNIWENPGETGDGKETDSSDNDGNGYVDDWRGWDFVNSDNSPLDDNSHGTHVAGIAGAEGDNNTGVAGVCSNSKLMALKAFNANGNGSTAAIISAIDYAIEAGAQVINASFSSSEYSSSLYQAIEQAQEDGVLVVCAASNYGTNNNTNPYYPASYDLDNVIAVLATDHNDALSSFSNYGSYSVDLGAPGGTDGTQSSYNIYSSVLSNGYFYKAGTSMAAPLVTGAAALILGQRPTIDWWQAKTIVLKSVDYKSALAGKARTSGRLNLNSAVNYTTPVLPAAPTDLAGSAMQDGGFYDIELTWTDNSNNESGFRIYMLSSTGVYSQLASTGQNVTSYLLDDVGPGTYYFYVRAYRTDGESIKSDNVTVHTY